jgi:hypothetical protein
MLKFILTIQYWYYKVKYGIPINVVLAHILKDLSSPCSITMKYWIEYPSVLDKYHVLFYFWYIIDTVSIKYSIRITIQHFRCNLAVHSPAPLPCTADQRVVAHSLAGAASAHRRRASGLRPSEPTLASSSLSSPHAAAHLFRHPSSAELSREGMP